MLINEFTPKKLSDIYGLNKQKEELTNFVKTYKTGNKALLFYGPPGVGKTALVHAFCKEHNYELIEINASDKRNKEVIQSLVGNAVKQKSLFNRNKLILIDEIDGLSGNQDRGGITALINVIKKSPTPIILTCNDYWNKKLSGLRSHVKAIEFKKRTKEDIKQIYLEIIKKKELKIEDSIITELLKNYQGDVRAAINDFQTLGNLGIIRNYEKTIFQAMQDLFKAKEFNDMMNAFEDCGLDLNEIFLWLDENLKNQCKTKEELARAYEVLNKANKFYKLGIKKNYYRYWFYARILMTAGIANEVKLKTQWVKYNPPKKILKLWQSRKKRSVMNEVAGMIAKQAHTSKRIAKQQYFPIIKAQLKTKQKTLIPIDKENMKYFL